LVVTEVCSRFMEKNIVILVSVDLSKVMQENFLNGRNCFLLYYKSNASLSVLK